MAGFLAGLAGCWRAGLVAWRHVTVMVGIVIGRISYTFEIRRARHIYHRIHKNPFGSNRPTWKPQKHLNRLTGRVQISGVIQIKLKSKYELAGWVGWPMVSLKTMPAADCTFRLWNSFERHFRSGALSPFYLLGFLPPKILPPYPSLQDAGTCGVLAE